MSFKRSHFILGTVVLAACVHHAAEQAPAAPTVVQQIEPRSPLPSEVAPGAQAPLVAADTTEPYIDFYGVDSDVRLVLQRIAEIAKIDLIIPANIHKRISVQYVHVPVSVALK